MVDVGHQLHAVARRHHHVALDSHGMGGPPGVDERRQRERQQLIADPRQHSRENGKPGASLRDSREARPRGGVRGRPAMVCAEHQNECGEHPVEEDGNRPASPAFERVQRHTHRITEDHHAEVDRTDREQQRSHPSPRRDERAALTNELQAHCAEREDD